MFYLQDNVCESLIVSVQQSIAPGTVSCYCSILYLYVEILYIVSICWSSILYLYVEIHLPLQKRCYGSPWTCVNEGVYYFKGVLHYTLLPALNLVSLYVDTIYITPGFSLLLLYLWHMLVMDHLLHNESVVFFVPWALNDLLQIVGWCMAKLFESLIGTLCFSSGGIFSVTIMMLCREQLRISLGMFYLSTGKCQLW